MVNQNNIQLEKEVVVILQDIIQQKTMLPKSHNQDSYIWSF